MALKVSFLSFKQTFLKSGLLASSMLDFFLHKLVHYRHYLPEYISFNPDLLHYQHHHQGRRYDSNPINLKKRDK